VDDLKPRSKGVFVTYPTPETADEVTAPEVFSGGDERAEDDNTDSESDFSDAKSDEEGLISPSATKKPGVRSRAESKKETSGKKEKPTPKAKPK
jgi:hypothetical protein